MTTAFDALLNESLRDAMLALYLHEAVPNDPYLIEQGLAGQIKTANDLYEYWLLDVLVSQNVPTSLVACAIASLQQLINAMVLNMEPGYSDHSLTPEMLKTWRDGLNRYPIWAAIQQLHCFPDVYLNPTLRLTKTASFEQLESDLNQAQIQPETIQAAVLAYLGRFEEIANLKVCNGYIHGDDFANSIYYFIGKSPAENVWYWRSLDMSQRPVKRSKATPDIIPDKYDKPLPNAWTDWQRANVPISEKALEHTVRPCWFNNRLFVIWAEVELQDPDAMTDEGRADTVKMKPRFRLYASYKKYDDSWSMPRVYIENYGQTMMLAKTLEQIKQETQTIAVYDHSTSPESLFIALYSNYIADATEETGNKDAYDFLRTRRIDKNFLVSELFPLSGFVPAPVPDQEVLNAAGDGEGMAKVQSIGRLFAKTNADRLQYWLPTGTPVFGSVAVPSTYPATPLWNFENLQSNIKDSRKDQEMIYDRNNAEITLIVKQEEGFPATLRTTIVFVVKNVPIISLVLVYLEKDLGLDYLPLREGSTIKADGTDLLDIESGSYSIFLVPFDDFSMIGDPDNGKQFSVSRTAKGEVASLTGKLVIQGYLNILYRRKETFGLKRFPPNSVTQKFDGYDYYRGRVGYQQVALYPTDVQTEEWPEDLSQVGNLHRSSIVNELAKPKTFYIDFTIDQTTLRPAYWKVEWPDVTKLSIPLIYGVLVYHLDADGWAYKGGALKALRLTWGEAPSLKHQIAPAINNESKTQSLGTAQFIDFTKSSIQHSDEGAQTRVVRAPIRMNTVFARELINRAEIGMESLLSWNTQTQKTEPPLPDGLDSQPMDFSGAYYLYFLELFLYLPWLVAHRLNEEQQYDEARHWLAFLFDPSRQSDHPGHPGYWQSVPLEDPVWPGPADPSQAILYPHDPHQIALSFPVHFRKALYRLYIDIGSNQADQNFRELTPDGLAEAKLRYVHILDLLGLRPDVRQVDHWSPVTLGVLSSAKNENLRTFEQRLISAQRQLEEHPPLRIGKAPDSQAAPLLCLFPYGADSSLLELDNPYWRRPFNPELTRCWDRAESRVYNLRHNRDIAGNLLNLSLFAAPLDPRALLAAWGQGLSGAALSRLLNPQIPHYRFTFMFALAQNAVDSVIQFGATLLSLIERKESAQYLELQQRQAWNLAEGAVELQRQAMEVDKKNKAALEASQAVIAGRVNYYAKLVKENVSLLEIAAGAAHFQSGVMQVTAAEMQAKAETQKTVPNIVGLADGGQRIEGPTYAVMASLQAASSSQSANGQLMDRCEQYRRRGQEWTQALAQANLEAEQIKAQLAVYEEQHKATQLQLRQAQTALNQARATHDFLNSSNRFSRSQTYDWLNSKFAGFYSSAYATAQSLCQAAEACWQYEMGDFTRTFIRPGAWNASYRGLGAGEELKMCLQQMHAQYLKNNKRELEIRKTVSLKHLNAKDPEAGKTWAEIKKALMEEGACQFQLTQKMFDDDFPGQNHYMRRIKTVSVTLPGNFAPYTDVCALLTQNYSKVEMAATVGSAVKENLRANQQIALSHGMDDNGHFQINFQDERYLPFEFTGGISSWILSFPNKDAQSALINSLSNVVVHVCYTARTEGASL
jgi:hypothetical protein